MYDYEGHSTLPNNKIIIELVCILYGFVQNTDNSESRFK